MRKMKSIKAFKKQSINANEIGTNVVIGRGNSFQCCSETTCENGINDTEVSCYADDGTFLNSKVHYPGGYCEIVSV